MIIGERNERGMDYNARRVILQSLMFPNMTQRFDSVIAAHKNTFTWLYDDENAGFVPWLAACEAPGIFWIHGKPGAGKSTLMKYAHNHSDLKTVARRAAGERPLVCVNFFFSGRGTTMQQSLEGLLRAVLHQIITSVAGLAPEILPPYMLVDGEVDTDAVSRRFSWNESQLLDGLLGFVSQCRVPALVVLFIDGLDEFAGNHSELVDLLVRLAEESDTKGFQFKICAASRDENVFEDQFRTFPGFSIHEKTQTDIATLVKAKLGEHRQMMSFLEGDGTRKQATELIQQIVAKAEGVFIWVRLVVEDIAEGLRDGDDLVELHDRLAEIPTDLEDVYRRIISKIKERYAEEARTLFKIVHVHNGPIPLLQLVLATQGYQKAIDCPMRSKGMVEIVKLCSQMKRRLMSRCGCILEITRESQISQALATITKDAASTTDHRPESDTAEGKVFENFWIQFQLSPQVSFIHQTAKAFFSKEATWELFPKPAPGLFASDPWVCLMASYVHYFKLGVRYHEAFSFFQAYEVSKKGLSQSAKMAEISTGQSQKLLLSELDRAMKYLREGEYNSERYRFRASDSIWSDCDMLGHAVRWNMLLSVRDMLASDRGDGWVDASQRLLFYLDLSDEPECVEMMNMLLDAGISPNEAKNGEDSFWMLLLRGLRNAGGVDGTLRLIRNCFDRGADAKAVCGFEGSFEGPTRDGLSSMKTAGYNPLHFLIQRFPLRQDPFFIDLCAELARQGADPHLPGTSGYIPLYFARSNPTLSNKIVHAFNNANNRSPYAGIRVGTPPDDEDCTIPLRTQFARAGQRDEIFDFLEDQIRRL